MILIGWSVSLSVIMFAIFFSLWVFHSNFYRFGPSQSLHFKTITIDTTKEWLLLAVYCCFDALIKVSATTQWCPGVLYGTQKTTKDLRFGNF